MTYPTSSRFPARSLAASFAPVWKKHWNLCAKKLDGAGLGMAASGRIVLTGGGSLLDGIRPLAERILGVPVSVGRHSGPGFTRSVRLGRPKNIAGLPEDTAAAAGFATAAGLLFWAASAERPFSDVEFREAAPTGFLQKLVAFIRERV